MLQRIRQQQQRAGRTGVVLRGVSGMESEGSGRCTGVASRVPGRTLWFYGSTGSNPGQSPSLRCRTGRSFGRSGWGCGDPDQGFGRNGWKRAARYITFVPLRRTMAEAGVRLFREGCTPLPQALLDETPVNMAFRPVFPKWERNLCPGLRPLFAVAEAPLAPYSGQASMSDRDATFAFTRTTELSQERLPQRPASSMRYRPNDPNGIGSGTRAMTAPTLEGR